MSAGPVNCDRPVHHVTVFAPRCGPIVVGDTAQFMATANNPIGWPGILYTSSARPERFRWHSSNPNLASVSSSGMVRALSPGMVNISATADTVTGTLPIGLIEPIHLAFRPATARIHVGDTIRMTASLRDGTGKAVPDLRIFDRVVDYHIVRSLGDLSFVGIDTGNARIVICAAHREVSAIVTVTPRD